MFYEKMSKKQYIIDNEKCIKEYWEQQSFDSIPDKSKEKYFACFPYPYCNGLLHLGHAYTMLKVDYMVKYKRLKGFNVLFPFSFHCTGSPIVASADKLRNNPNGDVYNILKSMNVDKHEINEFVEPYKWLSYFPDKVMRDVKSLGVHIDWRRSFTTTDFNPYYDKFITWQFNKLIERKFVDKGIYPSVYCVEENQIVNDHDRKIGEGIKPIKTTLKFQSHTNMWICTNTGREFDNEYIKICAKYQNINIDDMITLFVCHEQVVTRSGFKCHVANVDQYYIDYTINKNELTNVLNTMTFYNNDLKNKMMIANNWIEQRNCTRTYGIGTKFPIDKTHLIESLSDSTIYMALYTIYHKLKTISIDQVNNELFDYVFGFSDSINATIDIKICDEMRDEFTYWYPFDLRVSGKDLINNHLIMCVYNHYYLWQNQCIPKSYYCNGYLNIDNKKMSKSEGTFITIFDACKTSSIDGLRMALADAGDSLDDATFVQSMVETFTLANYDINKVMTMQYIDEQKLNTFDKTFVEQIKNHSNNCIEFYEQMSFKNIICEYWGVIKNCNRYIKMNNNNMNKQVQQFYCSNFAKMFAPIMPHFCENIWRNILNNNDSVFDQIIEHFDIDKQIISMNDYFNEIRTKIFSRNMQNINMTFVRKNPQWLINVQQLYEKTNDIKYVINQTSNEYKKKVIKNVSR